ncbi:MAG TPA: hypothetical protein VGW78_02465 [Candidatus Babeliales bacterium]|nr:hypothetical protein [Candidatus Babeliales bacterium]
MKKFNSIYSILAAISLVLTSCSWWHIQESKQEIVENKSTSQQILPEPTNEITQPILEESTKSVIEKINTEEQKIIALPEKHNNKRKKVSRKEFKQKRAKRKKITNTKNDGIEIVGNNNQRRTDQTAAMPQGTMQDNSLQTSGRSIIIQHIIDIPTLTVKHWTGTYSPNLLTVTINNHEIPIVVDSKLVSSTPHTITIEDTTFTMTYYYEFMGGMRKDKQTFTYTLTGPQVSALNMSFSWDTPWHVVFDNAKPNK